MEACTAAPPVEQQAAGAAGVRQGLDAVVQRGDRVLLRLNGSKHLFGEAKEGAMLKLGKKGRVSGAQLAGVAWGAELELRGAALVAAPARPAEALSADAGAETPVTSKLVWDDNTAQRLTNEDIARMKQEGTSGDAIVAALVSNSSSFKNKSQFAQVKYLNKKKKKHEVRVAVLRPSLALVCEALEASGKLAGLRTDSLAAMLTWAGVASGQRLLVHDPTSLVICAALERLAGRGRLVALHSGPSPSVPLVARFNFSPADLAVLQHTHLARALASPAAAAPAAAAEAAEGGALVGQFACLLLVATKHDPRELLLPLLEHLQPSGAFAVFCPFLPPLAECFSRLLASGRHVHVQLSESWLRAYQVLPGRTHPTMSMHGASGYLLTGIRLAPPAPSLPRPVLPPTPSGPAPSPTEPDAKRAKRDPSEEAVPGAAAV